MPANPHRYGPPTLPENDLPGVHDLLMHFHHSVADLQRRVLRIIAEGLGAHETFFDEVEKCPEIKRRIENAGQRGELIAAEQPFGTADS